METTEDKTPALFLKLNLQNVFDIVYWSHLIENVAGPGFQTMLVHLDFHHLQHGKVKGNTDGRQCGQVIRVFTRGPTFAHAFSSLPSALYKRY